MDDFICHGPVYLKGTLVPFDGLFKGSNGQEQDTKLRFKRSLKLCKEFMYRRTPLYDGHFKKTNMKVLF